MTTTSADWKCPSCQAAGPTDAVPHEPWCALFMQSLERDPADDQLTVEGALEQEEETMSEATAILARARAREQAREAAYVPIDYARMNRVGRGQKAALTRARNSGDRDRVVLACVKAVREWNEIGAWPDNWSTWQRAIDDVFPVFHGPRLEDLA